MEALIEPLGLRLPTEARRWWGWHDGATLGGYAVSRELGPGRQFLSLSSAVEEYQQRRRLSVQAAQGSSPPMSEPDWWWHPTWLPLVDGGGPTIACECSVVEGQPCPILVVNWHEAAEWIEFPEAASPVKARSFGDMVGLWLKALDCGAWRFDPSQGHWDGDYTLLDPADELTRLI